MAALYWFALVLGAGLLLFSLVGDVDGGADGLDPGVDVDGCGGAHGYEVLSIRTITYFMFAFGAAGVLLGLAGTGSIVRLLTSLGVGVVSGGASAAAFRWLGQTQSGQLQDDDSLVGLVGRVVVPLSMFGTGKVEVARSGREIELLARPFDQEPDQPETWTSVVIVEIEHGMALVTPYTDTLEPGRNPPGLPRPGEE
jgi:hypothetical protein